jgi:hypothetical protein
VVNGIFNMVVGSATPLNLTFDRPYYLGVTVGADAEMSPRQPLTAQPYAFNAATARTSNAPVSADNIITVIDASIGAGYDSSIAIGSDGFPVISYYQTVARVLKVAKCSNLSCNSAVTLTVVDNAGDVGRGSSITVGSDGLPIISNYDNTNAKIKVAKCQAPDCSSAIITSLVTALVVSNVSSPIASSISVGSDGLPIISFTVSTSVGGVSVAKCSNVNCTVATVNTLSSSRGVLSAVAHGSDNLPRVLTSDTLGLRIHYCTSLACSAANSFSGGSSISLANLLLPIDGSSLAVGMTSSSPFEMRGVGCDGLSCGSTSVLLYTMNPPAVGPGGFTGTNQTMVATTVGNDGLPVIVFRDRSSGILYVLRCSDSLCAIGPGSTAPADPAPSRDTYSSIAIGSDGLPVISYVEYFSGSPGNPTIGPRLKVLKCGNAACGAIRRR